MVGKIPIRQAKLKDSNRFLCRFGVLPGEVDGQKIARYRLKNASHQVSVLGILLGNMAAFAGKEELNRHQTNGLDRYRTQLSDYFWIR